MESGGVSVCIVLQVVLNGPADGVGGYTADDCFQDAVGKDGRPNQSKQHCGGLAKHRGVTAPEEDIDTSQD